MKDYFLPIRKQDLSTVCGIYATCFAAEAKANMRNIGKEQIDIDSVLYNWNMLDKSLDKIIEPFLQNDSDKDFKVDDLQKMEKLRLWCNTYSLQIKNIQRVGHDLESLRLVLQNTVHPILYISFNARTFPDNVTAYKSSTKTGTRFLGHVVTLRDIKEGYLELQDSNMGKYNRIYFEDMNIIQSAWIFGVDKYYKTYNHPLRKVYITQKFGENKDYYAKLGLKDGHPGTDYRAKTGTPIYPVFAGTVGKIDYNKYEGNRVFIHNGVLNARYCHLSEAKCKAGDIVTIDSIIGLSGNTGESTTAEHLHLGIQNGTTYIDPLSLIK